MRPPTAALLLPLFLAACAEKIPPAILGPGVPLPEAHSTPTLGVLPVADRRPEIQHRGKKPLLLVLLVWNSRTGDYVTGERAFQGSVVEQVTALVSGTMSGGRFGESRVIDASTAPEVPSEARADFLNAVLSEARADAENAVPSPEVPSVARADSEKARAEKSMDDPAAVDGACRAPGLRFLARTELHDLYGTLHEKSYFWILPTPWAAAAGWDRKRTDPLGVVRLVVQVRDCATGAIVFERDLRSENRYAHATLSQAAGLALTDVLQKLRNETLSAPATPYVPVPEEYRHDLPPPHRP